MREMEEAGITWKLSPLAAIFTTTYGTAADGINPIPNTIVKLFDDKYVSFQHTLTDGQGNAIMYNMLKGTYAMCCASGRLLAGHMLVQNDEFRKISLVYTADTAFSMGTTASVAVVSKDSVETPLNRAKIILEAELDQNISLTYTADDGVFAFYNVPDGYG